MIKITLDTALKNHNISRYELARYHIIDNYYKNKVVRYDSFILNKICIALDCQINDIIKYEKD